VCCRLSWPLSTLQLFFFFLPSRVEVEGRTREARRNSRRRAGSAADWPASWSRKPQPSPHTLVIDSWSSRVTPGPEPELVGRQARKAPDALGRWALSSTRGPHGLDLRWCCFWTAQRKACPAPAAARTGGLDGGRPRGEKQKKKSSQAGKQLAPQLNTRQKNPRASRCSSIHGELAGYKTAIDHGYDIAPLELESKHAQTTNNIMDAVPTFGTNNQACRQQDDTRTAGNQHARARIVARTVLS
jgi:hypothetical protein